MLAILVELAKCASCWLQVDVVYGEDFCLLVSYVNWNGTSAYLVFLETWYRNQVQMLLPGV